MRVTSIPASWIDKSGYRFDCNPYMSGAIEARLKLDSLVSDTEALTNLTSDIVNAGRIKRIWADSKDYGHPFLSSTDILKADLSHISYISHRAVEENPKLLIKKGWILITRAGSIGKMCYSRADMDNMACTEDVLRVIPNENKVPSGYLYAYLRSKYGLPIVISGTYGAIIQHIEPHHLADLPVPRFERNIEKEVNGYVTDASDMRTEAAHLRDEIFSAIGEHVDLSVPKVSDKVSNVGSTQIGRRMDAFHFSNAVSCSRNKLNCAKSKLLSVLVEDVFEPNRGARLKVKSREYGVPFLSSSEVFRLDPTADYLISTEKTPHLASLIVSEQDLLLPRSGQLGGIIGRAVLPLPSYYGFAASEHLVRIRCKSRDDAYYLWAIFASDAGYYATIGTAFGSSIPSLDCDLLKKLRVPFLGAAKRRKVVELVAAYINNMDKAIHLERQAVSMVEDAIDKAARH